MPRLFATPLLVLFLFVFAGSAQAQDHARVVRDPGSATAEQRAEAIEALQAQRRRPNPEDPLVIAALERAETLFADGRPVRDELGKAVLRVAHRLWNRQDDASLDALTPHPQAGRWFGELPADAPRIAREIGLDTAVGRWHSTGLYAAPGEVITVTVPDALVGKNVRVRLSGHHDDLGRRGTWRRPPGPISVAKRIDANTLRIGSRFGGAVYLDFGRRPLKLGTVRVQIKGAVEAPIFIAGRHDNDAWQAALRDKPAPYAELVGERVILSVPSAWVRELDDAAGLVAYWDNVMKLHDELAGTAHLRTSPERINVDVQISAGLYHAGYPMQGAQGQSRNLVDFETLKQKGTWGWFHELGHEAQRRPDTAWSWDNPYTFDGSVECTVNLFTTHAMDTLGITDRGGWSWTGDPEQVAQRAKRGIEGGGYTQVGVGEKLAMWLQLRDAFGWEPIGAYLKTYSDDQDEDPARLPKNEQAERDAFAMRMSKAVGKNLVPFIRDTWKLPVSDEVEAQLKDLKVWQPEGF